MPRARFVDESGNWRPVDAAFLAWRRSGGPVVTHPEDAVDVRLWAALTDDKIDVDAEISTRLASGSRTGWDAGALFPQAGVGLEAWTESELSAIHAVWWLARQRSRADWSKLVDLAVDWHVENIQPDNATTHPWGLHVFLLRFRATGHHDHRLHAEMLLHNCQITMGRPDAMSAEILMDSANALDQACSD